MYNLYDLGLPNWGSDLPEPIKTKLEALKEKEKKLGTLMLD